MVAHAQPFAGGGGPYPSNGSGSAGTVTLTAGTDIANVITNGGTNILYSLACGGFTVNTAIVLPTGVGVKGQGDCTVITNNVTLANGCCFTLASNNNYVGYMKGWCNVTTNNFCAFVGANQTFLTNAYSNAVIENITYTNSTTDGFYVSSSNACYGVLRNCRFQSLWDAGAVFLGNHLHTYYNCTFTGIGPSQLAAVAHGFNTSGGSSNIFFGCYFDGENPNNGSVGSTNAYGFAMDGNANGPVIPLAGYAELNGCHFKSAVNNTMQAFDISNGHDTATNGVIQINGSTFDPTKTFGPYNTSWLVATGGVQTTVNTNQLIITGAGDTIFNTSYTWTQNIGAVSIFTNTVVNVGVAGTASHWTNWDNFATAQYVSTGALPTNANWVNNGGGLPVPNVVYGFTLTNQANALNTNVLFNGLITPNWVKLGNGVTPPSLTISNGGALGLTSNGAQVLFWPGAGRTNDNVGTIEIVTASSGTLATTLAFHVTFGQPKPNPDTVIILSAYNSATVAAGGKFFPTNFTTTGFDVWSGTAPASTTTYSLQYLCFQ